MNNQQRYPNGELSEDLRDIRLNPLEPVNCSLDGLQHLDYPEHFYTLRHEDNPFANALLPPQEGDDTARENQVGSPETIVTILILEFIRS